MKEVHGVEGSEQGYEETKRKIGDAKNVHLQIGNILDLSFSDDFFHAYMVNQANSLICSSIDGGSIHEQMEQAAKQAEKIGEAVIVSARKPL